jgi:ferritin-like protein
VPKILPTSTDYPIVAEVSWAIEADNKLAKDVGKDNVTYQLVTHILLEEVTHEEMFENLLER